MRVPVHVATTVLLVEEPSATRALLARALEDGGFAVVEADDAVHALAHLGRRAAAIAVIDRDIPITDGIALGSQIHRRYPAMRVLLMSDSLPRLHNLPPTFLAKPFHSSELLTRVRVLLALGW